MRGSSRTSGPGTCASPHSSITCRMTMSQRSSGSQRAPVTEDERLLTPTSHAERRGFTPTDPWRGAGHPGGFLGGGGTPPPPPQPRPPLPPPPPPPPRTPPRGGGRDAP